MVGATDHTLLDWECYLELWSVIKNSSSYKLNIKKIQHAIPKILQTCYLVLSASLNTPYQNSETNSELNFEIIVE